MNKYSLTCPCGDTMPPVEAANKTEAVMKIKSMMTEEVVKQHMADKHPGDPIPSQQEMAAMIEQNVVEM